MNHSDPLLSQIRHQNEVIQVDRSNNTTIYSALQYFYTPSGSKFADNNTFAQPSKTPTLNPRFISSPSLYCAWRIYPSAMTAILDQFLNLSMTIKSMDKALESRSAIIPIRGWLINVISYIIKSQLDCLK